MTPLAVGAVAVLVLLLLIYLGVHIGVGLIVSSFGAIALLRSPEIALRMVGAAANDSLREYLFAVVPLFVLMGLLVMVSGLGRDIFDLFERLLTRVRAGLGIATVFANAVFASITGISIASASVFAKVAVPEMMRHGYTQRFAVGVVAGSSVLGMLIPPSLLMIIYGVIAEESIGRLFLAGVVPGLMLSCAFAATILLLSLVRPGFVHERAAAGPAGTGRPEVGTGRVLWRASPIVALVGLVLGGLYTGWFSPTEAGAVGAAGALAIALARRTLDPGSFWQLLVETGHVAVSVLFLVMAASLFSRMLALSGLPVALADLFLDSRLGPHGFLAAYLVLLILLGCLIDSVSIMLILLPIALPVAREAGFDMIWFGVLTVFGVEIGLLTPPFGLSVYTVKSALGDAELSIRTIFAGTLPFVAAMVVVLVLLALFPGPSVWLAHF